MQELDPSRNLTPLKPEGTWRLGKPKLKWLESVEEDIKNMGMRNWRDESQNREECRTVLEKTKVHQEL
jgi:hypothetical protein